MHQNFIGPWLLVIMLHGLATSTWIWPSDFSSSNDATIGLRMTKEETSDCVEFLKGRPGQQCAGDYKKDPIKKCCVPCNHGNCRAGYERVNKCADCTPCPVGEYSEGGIKCHPCKNCEKLGTKTVWNCTQTTNSICRKECLNKNKHYDSSLSGCDEVGKFRVISIETTTFAPTDITGCKMNGLDNPSQGCITTGPSNAGMMTLLGAGGVVVSVCIVLLLTLFIVAFLYWYCKSREKQKYFPSNSSDVEQTNDVPLVNRSTENEYAEISENGSRTTMRNVDYHRTPTGESSRVNEREDTTGC